MGGCSCCGHKCGEAEEPTVEDAAVEGAEVEEDGAEKPAKDVEDAPKAE